MRRQPSWRSSSRTGAAESRCASSLELAGLLLWKASAGNAENSVPHEIPFAGNREFSGLTSARSY
jgi:hypothetical protein